MRDSSLRALRDPLGSVTLSFDSVARLYHRMVDVMNYFPAHQTQLHNPKWSFPATADWLWCSPAAM